MVAPVKLKEGALGAVGKHAALVLDVDHALLLVLAAVQAALLARKVEIRHAHALGVLALPVLRTGQRTRHMLC